MLSSYGFYCNGKVLWWKETWIGKGSFQVTNLRSQSFVEESQSRGQKLLTSFLFIAFSICFLTQLRTTCWGVAQSTVCWALRHRLIQEMSLRLAHKSVSRKRFLSWNFLLPKWLCLVSSLRNETCKLIKQPTNKQSSITTTKKNHKINVENCWRWQENMEYDLCAYDIILKGFWTFHI